MDAIPAEDYRSITLLNEMGDIEVTWDSQNVVSARRTVGVGALQGG